jgi:hypothetical protein
MARTLGLIPTLDGSADDQINHWAAAYAILQ